MSGWVKEWVRKGGRGGWECVGSKQATLRKGGISIVASIKVVGVVELSLYFTL